MITAQSFSLATGLEVPWMTTQEKALNRDYPFQDLHDESEIHFVARTYLQFLWLPQVSTGWLLESWLPVHGIYKSIMPLNLLVPSLLRVAPAQTGPPHPLHALLEPLLLGPRAAADKYRVELPQILADGGGAGEMEESMM